MPSIALRFVNSVHAPPTASQTRALTVLALRQLLLRGRFVEVATPSLHVRLHEASAGHGIGTGDYAAVHRTFFPDNPPANLLRWRATRYRKMWDVLRDAASSSSQRLALQARYAKGSAIQLLPI